MSILSSRSGLAFVLAAPCLAGRTPPAWAGERPIPKPPLCHIGSQADPSASLAIYPTARARTLTATFRALTAVTPEAVASPICATIFQTAGLSAGEGGGWGLGLKASNRTERVAK